LYEEAGLLKTLALHRNGTKYDRLPVSVMDLPMPEIIRQAANELDNCR
jgi:hypothetical protein